MLLCSTNITIRKHVFCCYYHIKAEFIQFTWWIHNGVKWLPTRGPSQSTRSPTLYVLSSTTDSAFYFYLPLKRTKNLLYRSFCWSNVQYLRLYTVSLRGIIFSVSIRIGCRASLFIKRSCWCWCWCLRQHRWVSTSLQYTLQEISRDCNVMPIYGHPM